MEDKTENELLEPIRTIIIQEFIRLCSLPSMGDIRFFLRFNVVVNNVTLDCEKLLALPFVPQIGMGFRVSRRYDELVVKNLSWTDDGDEKQLTASCGTITHATSIETCDDVEADLKFEGWDVVRASGPT